MQDKHTLLTKAAPAMPRRPAIPCPVSEQSSSTNTISTLCPSALAFSAANPNCSLSPTAGGHAPLTSAQGLP